jgi:hypothetical protein
MRGSRRRGSQVLTGSNWHEVMYSTMWATHPVACAFFLFYYVMLTYAKPSRSADAQASKLCKAKCKGKAPWGRVPFRLGYRGGPAMQLLHAEPRHRSSDRVISH